MLDLKVFNPAFTAEMGIVNTVVKIAGVLRGLLLSIKGASEPMTTPIMHLNLNFPVSARQDILLCALRILKQQLLSTSCTRKSQ